MAAEHFRLAQNGGQVLPGQRLSATSQVTWKGGAVNPEAILPRGCSRDCYVTAAILFYKMADFLPLF